MPSSSAIIVIDGGYGEGGGGLLRTALTMSALTQQPLKLINVRAATKFPGLDAEDLTVITALAESVSAETVGCEVGSQAISFLPTSRPRGFGGTVNSFRNESGRGGNALVIANTLLPVAARCGTYSCLTVEGETYGMHALSFDAFANVTLSVLKRMGLYVYADQRHAGFGRESDGEVYLEIEPSAIEGIEWADRGRFLGVRAVVATSNLPDSVGERGVSHLRNLAKSAGFSIEAEHQPVLGKTQGAFCTAWAAYEKGCLGGAAMGGRGLRIESLVQSAFEEVFGWMSSSASIDPYLADQVLIPAVLAEGSSTFRIARLTQRFLTSVWVVKQFVPIHITVRGSEGSPGLVTIQH